MLVQLLGQREDLKSLAHKLARDLEPLVDALAREAGAVRISTRNRGCRNRHCEIGAGPRRACQIHRPMDRIDA